MKILKKGYGRQKPKNTKSPKAYGLHYKDKSFYTLQWYNGEEKEEGGKERRVSG